MVFEGEDGRGIGGDEGGVDSGAAVGYVVGLDVAGVVGGGQEADPVRAAGAC